MLRSDFLADPEEDEERDDQRQDASGRNGNRLCVLHEMFPSYSGMV